MTSKASSTEGTALIEASIRGFFAAVIFGGGFHVGWGLISVLAEFVIRSVGP